MCGRGATRRLRRQRQDECCNAHRCNLSLHSCCTAWRRRAVEPVLCSLPKCSSPKPISADAAPRQRTRRRRGPATRETDGSRGLGLGDARACAAAARPRLIQTAPGDGRGDGRLVRGRMEVPTNYLEEGASASRAAAAGASPEGASGLESAEAAGAGGAASSAAALGSRARPAGDGARPRGGTRRRHGRGARLARFVGGHNRTPTGCERAQHARRAIGPASSSVVTASLRSSSVAAGSS